MENIYPNLAQREKRVLRRLLAILCCVAASFLFLIFQGGKLAFMVFIIVTVLSIYLAMGRWSGITRTRGIRTLVHAEHSTVLEAGTSLTVSLELKVPGVWPVPYLVVRDRLIKHGGGQFTYEHSLVPDLSRRGMVEYKTQPLQRGFYRFGETECSTEDIFGIFEHSGFLDMPQSFSVLPQSVKIREWGQLHRLFKGQHHHSVTVRAQRETTQINGVREYAYGDRLSRIHWTATAKMGNLKSKEFERESVPTTVIVLDRQGSQYGNPDKFELAVSIAASLLEYAGKRDLAMGLLSVGADTAFFEPKYNHSNHSSIKNHLIGVQADGNYSMQQILNDRSRLLPAGSLIVLISPLSGEAILRKMGILEKKQMIFCHLWLPQQAEEPSRWLKELHLKGHLGYPVYNLQDLPVVLGGNH